MNCNRYFTSDLHFGHANIIKYCNRPFETVEEMDEAIIHNWNARVTSNDIVYVIGDVMFCRPDRAKQIMSRLKGRIKLVKGNHDKKLDESLFEEILPPLYEETIDGIKAVMCHYPLMTWNKAHYGSFMLHGHQHNKQAINDPRSRRYDVGVDANGYSPVLWQEIKKALNEINPNHRKDY